MAHASLPKLVPIDTSNMCPANVVKPTLSEVLQSDPVKRLFNQPNLVIKTIPLDSATESDKDVFGNKKNGMNTMLVNTIRQPEVSIVPVRVDEEEEDANLLPSKIEDKKSEIALLPIRKKICGHYEPCENIICDVTVQQYVDQDGTSPMLATSIEEEEINAPVSKHCSDELCDALSIDHNCCRRALIKLYRCDQSRTCDICETTLKGWKKIDRIYHKNCRRTDEYRHNTVDRLHLLRERMRERELQILAIAKMRRNDYSDPMRAMEILRRNEELIIIPKTVVPSQQPIITITSVPVPSIGSNPPNAQIIDVDPRASNSTTIGCSSALSRGNTMPDGAEENKRQLISRKVIKFPNLQPKSFVTCTVTTVPLVATSTSVVSSRNQYVHLAAASQTASTVNNAGTISIVATTGTTTNTTTSTVQSLRINNWVVSPSHVLTTTPIQPKSFLTPIRVLPITNLITAPSLLHRTQGIPKFCIMADNLLKPVTVSNPPAQQPAAGATTTNASNLAQQKVIIKVPIQHNPQKRDSPTKKTKSLKKKNLFCTYCSKHFSTDWYFKMHVSRHEQKPFSCSLCDKSFSNKFDMKKHVTNQHTVQKYACNKCHYVCKSPISFSSHLQIHGLYSTEANKLKDEKHCTTTLHDLNGVHPVNCVDSLSNTSDDNKVCINGEATQREVESPESACVKEHDGEKPLEINGNNSPRANGFTFVSVKEDIDPETCQNEVIMSR